MATASELHCLVPFSLELEASGQGRLSGRTLVVKDLFAIKGHTSSFGHSRWRETHAPAVETAVVVRRLLDAGARMVGLAKMDQLAYSLVGNAGEGEPPVNPLYPDRFTGGSSSGCASAVAGGVADIGLGTDTAGSIRVPAAACGLFGIRPTHGAIDSGGVIALAESFDVVGLHARTADVLTEAFDVLVDASTPPEKEIAELLVPREALALVEQDAAVAIRAFAAHVAGVLGARVREMDDAGLSDGRGGDLLARLQGRQIWKNHGVWVEANDRHLAEDVRTRLRRCRQRSLSPPEEQRADEQAMREYLAGFEKRVGHGQAVVMPVMRGRAPLRASGGDEQREFRRQTFQLVASGSLCGAPQVVIPVRRGTSGPTIGASLLGPRGSDRALLAAAVMAAAGASRVDVG